MAADDTFLSQSELLLFLAFALLVLLTLLFVKVHTFISFSSILSPDSIIMKNGKGVRAK
jgi:hypothetical protein